MIVYLDQNKWIELARAINGVDNSDEAELLRRNMPAAIRAGCIFPLSAIHIIEFSRIKKDQRRSRLGQVMWNFSRGITTSPLHAIIFRELEVAFSNAGYEVSSKPFEYLGRGIPYAFGEVLEGTISKMYPDEIDRAMLCGFADIPPIQGGTKTYRENFVSHLSSLHERKQDLDKSKWSNWLYAISMVDILDPLHKVMTENRIPSGDFETWGPERLSGFLDSMPTRAVDIHLHRQVLKNPEYRPKLSDLEDWAGLSPAACYADVVICEKHFADLLKRDGFKTKARIETSLCSFVQEVGQP
ncbi:hypothetical protein ABA45_02280 [Marinobacter psychrophilus]|uniref:Uncharacterized protein n=1 Tax=Marinobacter psychrophilus TaxID=330734 RepID=A0A0H4I8L1_9GAMM|nr:hypothetical protein [Marinobacter psychrophilus]AKO51387.1 hypothetical protein ABA45_02280 [Marinobacter psychrophilus]